MRGAFGWLALAAAAGWIGWTSPHPLVRVITLGVAVGASAAAGREFQAAFTEAWRQLGQGRRLYLPRGG